MQRIDGQIVVSATDLAGWLACDHLASLELGALAGLWERPWDRDDPELEILRQYGDEHERRFLERLRAEGRTVVELPRPEGRSAAALRAAEAEVVAAMRAGIGAIYQATLFDGRWLGYADFLVRVDRPSPALGPWSYEVVDTKLARSVKGGALIQVCLYAARLASLQGVAPDWVHVVTGDGHAHRIRLAEVEAYFRTVKLGFERVVFGEPTGPARDPATAPTYPHPVEHCRVCAWFPRCIERRRADDHLSLVAGIRRRIADRLAAVGIETLAELGRLPPGTVVPDVRPTTLEQLRAQARLQLLGRERGELLYELVPPPTDEPVRGLALLPEPSPLDLFFDIEADPWVADGGLEYLLGVLEAPDGEPIYTPIWAHDRAAERRALEQFLDLVVERLDRDPTMHVYHYGGYESGALKRLVQRHQTREAELDRILRAGVLVDLYTVVRTGLRIATESYSLKAIERLYLPAREGPVTEAGFSVLTYEAWLRDREPGHLADLAAYNRDDCVSTWRLRDWLEARRREAVAAGWALPRPAIRSGEASEKVATRDAAAAAREEALRAGVPADPAARSPEEAARHLLAGLVGYFRREDKPAWWRWFELAEGMEADALVDAPDAIGRLEPVGVVAANGRSVVVRYRFPPQDHRFAPGDTVWAPRSGEAAPWRVGTVEDVDDVAGTIDLRRRADLPDPPAIIIDTPRSTVPLAEAVARLADDVIARGLEAEGRHRAARDLLLRLPPRLRSGLVRGPLRAPGESVLEAARRLVVELHGGVLAVQGPPGTGKTYIGARLALAAVAAGRGPVGITAQSHRAIGNAVEAIVRAAAETGQQVRIVQKPDAAAGPARVPGVEIATTNAEVDDALRAGVDIVAGTPWLFARRAIEEALGLLIVDEAGQLALASVLAASGAAASLVLLGDPNQLPQVSQGLHPEGAEASALGHLLADHTTLPESLGLFIDETRRMHPDITSVVSELFYEGRLRAHPHTYRQRIEGPPPLGGTGVRFWPVDHTGNGQRSREEAAVVADIVEELLGRTWIDETGARRPIGLDDILVVAPYNAHVAAVAAALEGRLRLLGWPDPGHARERVGTVDKFQGREAAVAIYSLAASSAEEAPRGVDFLFDRHRLNVAVSRARALAVVVGSPELLRVRARTADQMRLASAVCRLVEVATGELPVLGEGGGAPLPAPGRR
jgi:predicted RecB family nuclease